MLRLRLGAVRSELGRSYNRPEPCGSPGRPGGGNIDQTLACRRSSWPLSHRVVARCSGQLESGTFSSSIGLGLREVLPYRDGWRLGGNRIHLDPCLPDRQPGRTLRLQHGCNTAATRLQHVAGPPAATGRGCSRVGAATDHLDFDNSNWFPRQCIGKINVRPNMRLRVCSVPLV